MGRACGRVAILVGSHRYLCQDVSEMSFRSYMREHAPRFSVMESVTTFEDPGYAYENTIDLLKRTPDLAALWVAGGGIEGVVQAIADAGAAGRLVTIGRDLTEDTRSALIDGTIRLVLSHPLKAMAEAAVGTMIAATSEALPPFQQALLPFDLWTAENV
jgi:LacI family transcriptional regulator